MYFCKLGYGQNNWLKILLPGPLLSTEVFLCDTALKCPGWTTEKLSMVKLYSLSMAVIFLQECSELFTILRILFHTMLHLYIHKYQIAITQINTSVLPIKSNKLHGQFSTCLLPKVDDLAGEVDLISHGIQLYKNLGN